METFKKSFKWGMLIAAVNLILMLIVFSTDPDPHSPFYFLGFVAAPPFLFYFWPAIFVCGGGWLFGGDGIIDCGEGDSIGILVGAVGFVMAYLIIGFIVYSLIKKFRKKPKRHE